MHHYTYIITNLRTAQFYVGVRSSIRPPEHDNYFGSGTRIKNAIKKHGKSHFYKRILSEYSTRKDADAAEAKHITAEFLTLPGCLNIKEGGPSGRISHTKASKQKISEAHQELNKDLNRKLTRTIASMVGQSKPEVKARMSQAAKDKWLNPDFREHVTAKISASWTPERRARQADIMRTRHQVNSTNKY